MRQSYIKRYFCFISLLCSSRYSSFIQLNYCRSCSHILVAIGTAECSWSVRIRIVYFLSMNAMWNSIAILCTQLVAKSFLHPFFTLFFVSFIAFPAIYLFIFFLLPLRNPIYYTRRAVFSSSLLSVSDWLNNDFSDLSSKSVIRLRFLLFRLVSTDITHIFEISDCVKSVNFSRTEIGVKLNPADWINLDRDLCALCMVHLMLKYRNR